MPKTLLLAALLVAGSAFAQPPAQPPVQPPVQPPAPSPAKPPIKPPAQPAPTTPAQPAPTAATPAKPAAPRAIPAWSDPEFAKIGKMLIGTWKTTAPVAQSGAAAGLSDVVMSIIQVASADLKDAMYVETARLDSLHAPYRQAIFQLYTFKGKTRLRTYEFIGFEFDPASLTGLWTAPELFPEIKRTNLIATLDVDLSPNAAGFSGKTPYPYPTGVGGAVEMTSELTLTGDALTSADRGYDAAGKILWGSSEKERYTFTRFNPPVKVAKKPSGLLLLEYKRPSEGRAVETNDRVGVQFTGWLTSGVKWDTSRGRPQPAIFQVGGSPMAGLNEGLIGATKGTILRMYLPAPLAFGEKGYKIIPPNEDVILEIEVMSVEPAPTPVIPAGAAGAQPPPVPTPPPAPAPGSPKK